MDKMFEDKLKKILSEEGHSAAPFPGHEERFENKLYSKKTRAVNWQKWYYLVPAAAILAGAIVTLVLFEMKKSDEHIAAVALSDVSYEMSKVEQYYTERISKSIPDIDTGDPVLAALFKDLTKLESDYEKLKYALSANTSNSKVIDAMVANYKYRLQIIEMMQKYIEIQNNKNYNNGQTQAI